MRDVSKILSDTELVKLRAMLASSPAVQALDPDSFKDYPTMLFHEDWLTCHLLIRSNPDPLIIKEAKEKIRHFHVIVQDFEEEEEYLLDGWKKDPNDFIVADNMKKGLANPDPRVPTGREARRGRAQQALTRDQELRELKRRYATLTGARLEEADLSTVDDPAESVDEPAAPVATTRPSRMPRPSTARDRVKTNAARASSARA